MFCPINIALDNNVASFEETFMLTCRDNHIDFNVERCVGACQYIVVIFVQTCLP
jgi:hypothetical protein